MGDLAGLGAESASSGWNVGHFGERGAGRRGPPGGAAARPLRKLPAAS